MFYSLLLMQVFTLIYHQMTTRIDLFPFNGVRYYAVEERRKEGLVNGVIMGLSIGFSITNVPVLIGISGFIWLLIGIGAILNWWIPYLTGYVVYKMPDNESWSQVHERIFSKTIHILPHIKKNTRPNLEHMILHFFILASAVLPWVYLFRG